MYKAYVTKIFTEPAPGFDNLVLGHCKDYQVLVGKDITNGELGVLFEQGGQLSEEFALKNDLVRRKDAYGNKAGGMFEENRRVKAIKMKGLRSDGFWCPLSLFEYTGYDLSKLKEGDQFDELNGRPICNKYVTQATLKAAKNASVKVHKDLITFPKHIDTGLFVREAGLIPTGSYVMLSEKLHGTSGRYAFVQDDVLRVSKANWIRFKRMQHYLPFLSKFEKFLYRREWTMITGTRNTVLTKGKEDSFYDSDPFRFAVAKKIGQLHKNEVVYGEIVGYTDGGSLIMASQPTANLKSKAITKMFGEHMKYKYGCVDQTCDFYVYRICTVNEDGVINEYSWKQVEKRCRELGLKTVPVIEEFLYDGNVEVLKQKVDKLVNGESGSEAFPSRLDQSHVMEGVVVRFEGPYGTGWQKHKSWVFGVLEGYLADDDTFIDLEAAS